MHKSTKTPSLIPAECPIWCVRDHHADDGNSADWHHGAFEDLAETEAGGEHYYTYLQADTGKPAEITVALGNEWQISLPVDDLDNIAFALDDGGRRAMQVIGVLGLQAERDQNWWTRADNPPCPDWCAVKAHDVDAFARGELVHLGPRRRGGDVVLQRVARIRAGEAPGSVETALDKVEVTVGDGSSVNIYTDEFVGARLEDVLPVAEAIVALAKETS